MNNNITPIFKSLILTGLLFLLISYSYGQNRLKEIPPSDVQHQLERFEVAEGFEIELFAAEPMVTKPIQMNWDAKGRLWVVSSTVYPHLRPGEEPNDKIFVLEDTNGDGRADKSTVFAEGLITPTGILPGDGGVYVANSTEILHLKDNNGDGKADQKRVVLTGFGTGDTHHLIHTFRWGPDGLIYFNQSIYIYSHVETPFGTKRLHGGGVWQFNPATMELKVFARGLINPWGLQFDPWGNMFLTDGAGHEGINYGFEGATFLSAPGAEKIVRGLNPGQPKHSGLDIISGDHFPSAWQGRLVTNDFRANRINSFKLEDQGSGFASLPSDDLLWTDHIAFRPVDILMGPDGALYVADWYNPIIQHGEVDFHDPRRDQQHGRIWRIRTRGKELLTPWKLAEKDVHGLLEALKSNEDWVRVQAKQLLKEKDKVEVLQSLETWVKGFDNTSPKTDHYLIEALWVHQLIGQPNLELLNKVITSGEPKARAAAFRILGAGSWKWEEVKGLLSAGVKDPNAQVRKAATIALSKFQEAAAAKMALETLDMGLDEFSLFALWFTLKELESYWLPALKEDPNFFGDDSSMAFAVKEVRDRKGADLILSLLKEGKIPEEYLNDTQATLAKIAGGQTLKTIWEMALEKPTTAAPWISILLDAAQNRGVKPKGELKKIHHFFGHEDSGTSNMAIQLAGHWQMNELNQVLMKQILEAEPGEHSQQLALEALARLEDPKSREMLAMLTSEKHPIDIRVHATALLARHQGQKASLLALDLLNSAPSVANASQLFQAMMRNEETITTFASDLMQGGIPEAMAKLGRQSMDRYVPWYRRGDPDVMQLKKALEASGGVLPPEKMPQKLNNQQLASLVQEVRTSADAIAGESIYRRNSLICQNCHALGGAGGQLGPDLSSLGTSSPIDEIILSLLEPAESIKEGYELQRITKQDGGTVMGYLVKDGADELVIRNAAGQEVTIAKAQVSEHDNVSGSLMPPGLTSSLERQEFVDLIGFLSKLGKPGELRVPNQRLVRRWAYAATIPAEINEKEKLTAKIMRDLSFRPAYSKVSGALPLDELQDIKMDDTNLALLKFELEVLNKGDVYLKFNGTNGIHILQEEKWMPLRQTDTNLSMEAGHQEIYLLLDKEDFKENNLTIEVMEVEASSQTRLVMGS